MFFELHIQTYFLVINALVLHEMKFPPNISADGWLVIEEIVGFKLLLSGLLYVASSFWLELCNHY